MRKEVVNRIETIIKELWPTADVRYTLLKKKKNQGMTHDQKVSFVVIIFKKIDYLSESSRIYNLECFCPSQAY